MLKSYTHIYDQGMSHFPPLSNFLKVFSFNHKSSTGTLGKKNHKIYTQEKLCPIFKMTISVLCHFFAFFFKQLGDFSIRTLLGEIILDSRTLHGEALLSFHPAPPVATAHVTVVQCLSTLLCSFLRKFMLWCEHPSL